MASGNEAVAVQKFNQAKRHLAKARLSPILSQIDLALLYNESLLVAASASASREIQTKAFAELQEYLEVSSPDSPWWKQAQEHFARLGKTLEKKVIPSDLLAKRFADEFYRVVTTLEVAQGKLVTLSDPTAKVLKQLGQEKNAGVPASHLFLPFPSRWPRWRCRLPATFKVGQLLRHHHESGLGMEHVRSIDRGQLAASDPGADLVGAYPESPSNVGYSETSGWPAIIHVQPPCDPLW